MYFEDIAVKEQLIFQQIKYCLKERCHVIIILLKGWCYMKNLYIIGGTMGVGKTTVSRLLMKKLPNSVFLDGDWCWDSSPFVVTSETKAMVIDNICHLLNNFLHCSAYENVIFCWVMHQQDIIDDILKELDTSNCCVYTISLTSDEYALTNRLQER